MKILRKRVEKASITNFEFDIRCYAFLVKNLTSNDILVCFNDFDENINIKIPSYMSQIITQNSNHKKSEYATNQINVKSFEEGEVEIQCLIY